MLLVELDANPDKGARRGILLVGPSGYGKTTLALAICDFLAGKDFEYYLYDRREFLFRKRVIFIDEIHRMKEYEILFPFLDKQEHVFVLATNQTGGLPEALVNRCDEFIFTEYLDDELLLMAMEGSPFRTSEENFLKLVRAANRNPRVLKALVDNFGLYFKQNPAISPSLANFDQILADIFGIFDGQDTLCRRYLEVLGTVGGKASLTLLSNILQIDKATLSSQIEPVLLKTGKIQISSKGRILL